MRWIVTLALLVLVAQATHPIAVAELVLIDRGQPRAEIVIAESPPRSVRLAADELQLTLHKITGGKLPIVTQPTAGVPAQVYVGRSAHTDRLGISTEGLLHGAYRIQTGDTWLALVGDDTDFVPIEPWARNNSEIVSGKAQAAWDQITGALWGVPNILMYKQRFRWPGETGRPTALNTAETNSGKKPEPFDFWGFDERGSYNAVCGLLMKLGVRWYMPGELGEVLPQLDTITLPALDETVQPDFRLRRIHAILGVHGPIIGRWGMRLGLRDPINIQCAHGLEEMTHRPEILASKPEWFALYGGKRHNQPGQRLNQLCYSNEELLQETVRNVRAQFDHFKFEAVSVMPPDGYTAMCQCPLCAGKDSPHRDNRGYLSDYVWDFVNRVAKEVGKTHPDRKVLNCAYGVYTLPPEKIAKLEPNVMVSIVGGRRPSANRAEQQAELQKLRESWYAKSDNPIIVFENYPFTDRGWYLPAYTPHSIGESINATKGHSWGEDISLSVRSDFETVGAGFNHFQVYFSARMFWGGKQADVDAMFREYCRLFYGPAEHEMHGFFTFCEDNWQRMEKEQPLAEQALALFAAAKAKAEPTSLYGRRLALVDDYLNGLRHKVTQLAQKRGPVPVLRLVGDAPGIVVDGKLDDEYWQNCPVASTGQLRELQTGRIPTFGTTIKSGWHGNNLYFAIRCNERPGEKLNIGATKREDQAIWYGDALEINLETEAHSYYQIVVSPAGAVVDLDRGAERHAWFTWDSQAEVATHIADDHWSVEARIPVIQDENDPLHQVIGHRPTKSLPWHINICRQRIREHGAEYSALAPTGTDGFHELMKFAHLFEGNSHQFDVDPTVTDFLIASRAADELLRQRKTAEALAAYLQIAAGKVTDVQQGHALTQAAACARALGDHAQAAELAGRIKLPTIAKTVQMHNLLGQQKAPVLIEQFANEDLTQWPFWQAGDGYLQRGRAYSIVKQGEKAAADLRQALELTGDPRQKTSAWLALGNVQEMLLHDDPAALASYRSIFEPQTQLGGADEFYAVQGAARILSRAQKHDDALATLRRVKFDTLGGFWRGSMLLAFGDAQVAAGRKSEARATFERIAKDEAVESRHRQQAEERLKKTQ